MISRTNASAVAQMVIAVFLFFKIDFQYSEEEITSAILLIISIVAGIKIIIERIKKGGVKNILFKQPTDVEVTVSPE